MIKFIKNNFIINARFAYKITANNVHLIEKIFSFKWLKILQLLLRPLQNF